MVLGQGFARVDCRRQLRLSRIRFKRDADRETTASPIRRNGHLGVGWLAGSLAEGGGAQEPARRPPRENRPPTPRARQRLDLAKKSSK